MSDAIEIGGRPARTLAVTTSIANTGRLEKGVYDVSCTVDVAIATERDTPSPALTLDTGYTIYANNTIPVRVGEAQAIYAIAGGSGTLKYQRTGN